MGKVKMLAFEYEIATKVTKNGNSSREAKTGGFVLWQMMPDMWYVELAVGSSKVHAGSWFGDTRHGFSSQLSSILRTEHRNTWNFFSRPEECT